MRSVAVTVLLLSVLSLAACGGGGGSGPSAPAKMLFVSEASGNDLAAGTAAAPLRTITTALALATDGWTVSVEPGTYDAAGGETFPLQLPAGVSLVGDVAAKGDGPLPTRILGRGPYDAGLDVSVIGGQAATISGFLVEDPLASPTGYYGIMIDHKQTFVTDCTFAAADYGGVGMVGTGTPHVEDCVFDAWSYGVTAWDCSASGTIRGNLFRACTFSVYVSGDTTNVEIDLNEIRGTGWMGVFVEQGHPTIAKNTFDGPSGYSSGAIRLMDPTSSPFVTGNVFVGSGVGVQVDQGVPNLGDASDDGQNDFSAFSGVALKNDGTAVVTAVGNVWPHSPPTNGGDIQVAKPGTVVWGLLAGQTY